MKIFKSAYKFVRDNDNIIYKGFGFRHLSDATQYYVHPNNQSYKGTTTLCQSIGEAIVLFSLLLSSLSKEDNEITGDILINANSNVAYVKVDVPEDWRSHGVFESNIHHFIVLANGRKLSISLYDEHEKQIEYENDSDIPAPFLICFIVLLGLEVANHDEYNQLMFDFIDHPVADTFVNLHEDFYQNHKMDDYYIEFVEKDDDLRQYPLNDFYSYADSYKTIKNNKQTLKETIHYEIKKFDENEFTKEQIQLIPALGKEFKLPESLESICNAVVNGDSQAVLIHGPAGTGKTVSCKLICREIGLPIMDTVNASENLDEFILGKFIPEGDKIIFKESYVTKAIRDGGAVVFEEINFAKPAHLAFLNSLLDDNGFVRLDNGDMVHRHKNFRFFATMNLGYFGTKELNQALYNRFHTIIEIASLSDESIKRMLISRVPDCEAYIDKLLGVYHKLKKKIEQEELDVVISPRNLENWARLAKYEGYLKAAEKTIVPIAKCDRTLESTVRGFLLLYKWD